MPASFADYRIAAPLGATQRGPYRSWVALPPARLGHDAEVVLIELGALDEPTWAVLRERALQLAAIRSPWLPRLLDAGRRPDPGHPCDAWVTCDHPDARPLEEGSRKGTRGTALRQLAGAARGAHDLHQAGLAHGDIRESTVLSEGGETLLDLPWRAATGLPPQVARIGHPVELDGVEADRLWGAAATRASDVYALGALLYRRSSGALLHPDLAGDSLVTAAQRALLESPRLEALPPGPAAELIRECLDPDPARRPHSALAVAERIEELEGPEELED